MIYILMGIFSLGGLTFQSMSIPTVENWKTVLLQGKKVTIEEAIFMSDKAFRPSNLKQHYSFWKQEILKDHPDRNVLLKWLSGVRIEDFLPRESFKEFLWTYYPNNQEFQN